MNRRQAKQIDKGFYVELDEETNLHCVFGDNSGFAYSCHMSYEAAKAKLDEMVPQ